MATTEKKLFFVIITGMSGAGKTQAANFLEDIGFYCVDNLPPALIPSLAEACLTAGGDASNIALVIDVREGRFLGDLLDILEGLRKDGHRVTILFLDASEEALVRRFSETRRPHPLAHRGSLLMGIRAEREALGDLRSLADLVIDTSEMTVHQLKRLLLDVFQGWERIDSTLILLVSFGYKYGIPNYADLVLDLRFLPNPHFVKELKPLTGKDQPVADFILRESEARDYLEKLAEFLDLCLPLYLREKKSYLTLCFGCTGGRHRSVTIVELLGERLRQRGYTISVHHRDIGKE
jgi:UPF0042 nucleotide-binding protein